MPEAAEQSAEATLSDAGARISEDISGVVGELSRGEFGGLVELTQQYIVPAVSALLLLIVAYFFSKLIARGLSAPVRARVDETLGRFIAKLVFYSLMVFTVLGILGMFGISVASFAAVVAAAGFAIGLAFQGTLSNFASGVLLLVFRPFRVGDAVSAGGVTGKVTELDLFTTVFDTPDNRRIIVPNSSITSGVIENITHHSERRVDVTVGVDYNADLNTTREALVSAAETLQGSLIGGEGRGFQVVLTGLGDSSVDWAVRFWTATENYWGVKEALTVAVKRQLDAANIGIPYPTMDINVASSDVVAVKAA